ncbi:hypothetical protein EJ08DRAFT_731343 [Tothia fuscella]|uniref:Uncharacterized protein n=1 Tax=Tothia fuscella TaxID=1048955 RepID=A0A9P4NY50_9PEZI|nr:hypothetical protein EJ08DRAFT_731343 [Tothia fuscella]
MASAFQAMSWQWSTPEENSAITSSTPSTASSTEDSEGLHEKEETKELKTEAEPTEEEQSNYSPTDPATKIEAKIDLPNEVRLALAMETIKKHRKIRLADERAKEQEKALAEAAKEEAEKAEKEEEEELDDTTPPPAKSTRSATKRKRKAVQEEIPLEEPKEDPSTIGPQRSKPRSVSRETGTVSRAPVPRSRRKQATPKSTKVHQDRAPSRPSRKVSPSVLDMEVDNMSTASEASRQSTGQIDGPNFWATNDPDRGFIGSKAATPPSVNSATHPAKGVATHRTDTAGNTTQHPSETVTEAEKKRNGKLLTNNNRRRPRNDSPTSTKNETKSKKAKLNHQADVSLTPTHVPSSSKLSDAISMNSPRDSPAQVSPTPANFLTIPPKNLLELIPFIEHFDQQHKATIFSKDQEITTLKDEISAMENADNIRQTHIASSDAQKIVQLQDDLGESRKQNKDANDHIESLKKDLAQARSEASKNGDEEVASLTSKVDALTQQNKEQSQQISEYQSQFAREESFLNDIKAKYEKEKKETARLTIECKDVNEELRKEKLEGKKEKFEKLKAVVKEVVEMPQLAAMASGGFGLVSQALIQLQEGLREAEGRGE